MHSENWSIRQSTKRDRGLVSTMLHTADKKHQHLDWREPHEILEEALSVVQPAADAKQIEMVSGLSPMYLGVLADRDIQTTLRRTWGSIKAMFQ